MVTPKALSFSENPGTGRLRFKLRPLTNYAFTLFAFALIAAVLSIVISGPLVWLADGVVISILFYFNFFVWEKRGIGIRCPGCGRFISTNTPWICGFCQKKNERVDEFPFVNRCEHCSAEPKAYQCHHRGCGKLVFLTADHLEDNFARCATAPAEDLSATEVTFQEREKRKLEHELILTELTAKLNAGKERLEFMKKRTPQEKKKESFQKFHGDSMAARELAKAEKAANAEKYRDDPEMLKAANEVVEEWLRSET